MHSRDLKEITRNRGDAGKVQESKLEVIFIKKGKVVLGKS